MSDKERDRFASNKSRAAVKGKISCLPKMFPRIMSEPKIREAQ